MNTKLTSTGFILGFLAIILGAFASHYLNGKIDGHTLDSFKTGARYQMYQSFLLLLLSKATFASKATAKFLFYIIMMSVFCFSGIIYTNAFCKLWEINLGMLTILIPIGGFCMIISWGYLVVLTVRSKLKM